MTKEELVKQFKMTESQADIMLKQEELMLKVDNRLEVIRLKEKEKEDNIVYFTRREVEFLRSLTSDKIKRMFYSLFCFEKLHFHCSGWIRFDTKELGKLCNLTDVKIQDFAELEPFGFLLRASGKKKPVPTFQTLTLLNVWDKFDDSGEVMLQMAENECAEKYAEIVRCA